MSSSINRATAWTRSVSVALGAGSLRISLSVRMKGQRNKGLKAARLVLQGTRPQHVVHTLLSRLDVAVEHRDARAQPQAMRCTMDLEETVRTALVVADLPADTLGENLRAPPGSESSPAAISSRSTCSSLIPYRSEKNAISTAVKHFK